MSGRLGDYLELVRESQKKRLQITRDQKKQIADLFCQSAKDFEREAGKKNEKSLTYRWLKDYAKSLRREGKKLFQEIGDITSANIQGSSEAVTAAERRFYTELCPLLSERFSDVFSTVPKEMVEELISGGIYKDFAGLSERIWDYQRKYDWDIQTIINRGIVQQKPAYDLAKDLELYLRPDAKKPWNWGIVYPGVNRQVDYNAQRLARTAVTHAYQLSLQRCTRDNPFVEGYRWHSSNSGRVCPLCRERDGTVFEKDNLPLDHPNGMCVVTAEISKSYEEIGKELGDWAAGKSDNPELDNWLGNDRIKLNEQPLEINIQLFAKIPKEKLINYALDPIRQPDKAKAFKDALGYTLENYQELIDNINLHLDKKKLIEKGDSGYGMRYEYIMRLQGPNGKEANVLTAWIQDEDDIRLTSVYVTKKKVTE